MSNELGRYEFYLSASGAEDEELDKARRGLQRDLDELEGVDGTTQISAGDAPENARAFDWIVVGGIALALKKAGVFDAVVRVLESWIKHGEKRKVIIKKPDGSIVEFDGYSLKDIGKFGSKSSDSVS